MASVDFLSSSVLALELSQLIATKNDMVEIYCQHVYTIPSGYSKTGNSIVKENKTVQLVDFYSFFYDYEHSWPNRLFSSKAKTKERRKGDTDFKCKS